MIAVVIYFTLYFIAFSLKKSGDLNGEADVKPVVATPDGKVMFNLNLGK